MNRDPVIRCSFGLEDVPNRAKRFDENLTQRILSWEYTDKANGADEGKLKLLNHDLALFDEPKLALGNKVYVEWGYASIMHPVQAIDIRKYKGFREITVSGPAVSASSFLSVQRTRTWENTTEFEVAEEIAKELGFALDESRDIEITDQAIVRRGISQLGETDWAFLNRLARNVGCICNIRGGTFHFHEPRLGSEPSVTLTYFNSLQGDFIDDPDIEESTLGRPGRVTRRGHNPNERQTVEGSASNSEDPGRPTLGEVCEVPEHTWIPDEWEVILTDEERAEISRERDRDVARAQESIGPTTAETDSEAQSRARRQYRAGQREIVKMTCNVIGNPELRADTTVRIQGMSQKFNGNYYIEESRHSVDSSGYKTKLKLKRDAVSRSGANSRNRRSTEGSQNTGEPPSTGVRSTRYEDPETGEVVWTYSDANGDPMTMQPNDWEW